MQTKKISYIIEGISILFIVCLFIAIGVLEKRNKDLADESMSRPVETIIVHEIEEVPVIVEKEVTVIETQIVVEEVEIYPDDYCAYLEDSQERVRLEKEHWAKCYEEYPVATQVWLYLTDICKYNNYVAAGLIGNMMNECGGNTLDLHYEWYGGSAKTFYGLCMWSTYYAPKVSGLDLDEQLQYLSDTIENEFKNWGKLYQKGFTYEKFLNTTNAGNAAAAFMKIYERPGPISETVRRLNAYKAYKW